MPYSSLAELPDNVKKLAEAAQKIWMSSFNSAFNTYNANTSQADSREAYAFAVAWSAIRNAGYKDVESGFSQHTLPANRFSVSQVSYCKAYEDSNGDRIIEMPVSGVRKDREGDRFGYKAGNSMIRAYKSGYVPMFSNHGLDPLGNKNYRWQDIMGKYFDGSWADNGLDIISRCKLNPHNQDSDLLWKYVKAGMPVGFSVGGNIGKDFEIKSLSMDMNKDYFDDFELLETSPVGIPAYGHAVNKSFSESVQKQLKIKDGGGNMPENNSDANQQPANPVATPTVPAPAVPAVAPAPADPKTTPTNTTPSKEEIKAELMSEMKDKLKADIISDLQGNVQSGASEKDLDDKITAAVESAIQKLTPDLKSKVSNNGDPKKDLPKKATEMSMGEAGEAWLKQG